LPVRGQDKEYINEEIISFNCVFYTVKKDRDLGRDPVISLRSNQTK
jgi:hypothetical protein